MQQTIQSPIVGAAPTAAIKRAPATVAVDSLLAECETPVTPLETNTPRRSQLTARRLWGVYDFWQGS